MAQYRVKRLPVSISICLLTAAVISACGGGNAEAPADVTASPTVSSSTESDASSILNSSLDSSAIASGATPPTVEVALKKPVPTQAPAPAPAPAPTTDTTVAVTAPVTTITTTTTTTTTTATTQQAGSCGVDIGGWTAPVPSAVNKSIALRSLSQPGSRLHYISAATGSDSTGELYFWDGTRIVDGNGSPTNSAGAAYGTDPMKPSAAVRPFKRWAYVGPRAAGTDIGTRGLVGAPSGGTRAGYPDWWLFARGETFDLAQDLLSFERESNPSATTLNSSLIVPGGRSATERQVVGAYGDLCQPRPRFIHPMLGFVTAIAKSTQTLKNVVYQSLHFDGHDRTTVGTYSGITLLYQPAASVDILFEDVWLDAAMVNIGGKNAAQITFRRSLLTDAYSPDGKAHVQGIYYEGARAGQLRIEESILLRNGFRGDPKTMTWPPTADQVWNVFNRNIYIHGEIDSMRSGIFDSVSMLGTSGDQIRPGMRLERNFFYQGYVTMGAYGGYPDTAGATGSIVDNVLQRFVASGTNDNRGQPGWGLGLTSGAYGVEVTRNIVTGAQHNANETALQFSPLSWVCYAHYYRYATRGNKVYNNIFESGSASSVGIEGGVSGESPLGCSGYTSGGVVNNTIANNVMINSANREATYTMKGTLSTLTAIGATSATYDNNKLFTSRAAAASSLGWIDANRTLKTYLIANGVTVKSTDGFPEYFERATQQRRGQWRPEWTSRAINNHVRGGFNMAPIE